MRNTKSSTVEEELPKIEQHLGALEEQIHRPPYRTPRLKQDKVRKYFVERAIQIGEAALHISDLPVPLFVLSRVLCEDTLWMLWVSLSRQNAAEYHKTAISADAKFTRTIAEAGRIRLISEGQNVTREKLKELSAFKDERKAEEVASELGLSKLYDFIYRWNSLYVHGNTFDIELLNPKQGPAIPLNHIQVFLWVIFAAADRESGVLTSQQVLEWMGLSSMGGADSKSSKKAG